MDVNCFIAVKLQISCITTFIRVIQPLSKKSVIGCNLRLGKIGQLYLTFLPETTAKELKWKGIVLHSQLTEEQLQRKV